MSSPYISVSVTNTSMDPGSAIYAYTLSYVASSAASTSVSKAYTFSIGSTQVKSGSFDVNGKVGTYTICSGTFSAARSTSAYLLTFSASLALELTWSGSYIGTVYDSATVTVPAASTYTISYNANGGNGAPSSQSKTHGVSITLSSTKPTRTGYSFQGWGTSASDTSVDYAAGATYSANASITLYAIWKANTYTVMYNANGGSGAPGNQTKTHGKTLVLSSTIPTRTNYTFKGWGTSASATTVAYAAGANYTANATITLYAIWELSYTKPRIFNLVVSRCNSSGTANEEGTYAKVTFNWATDRAVSSIKIDWGASSATVSASGTSGSVSQVVGAGAISTDTSYTITVIVADSGGTFSSSISLGGTVFPIDVLNGGTGISFGKPAELADTADFGWEAQFRKPVYGNVVGLNKLPEIPANSDFNTYMDTGCWAVYRNDNAATIANIPVALAGRLEVYSPTGEGLRLSDWSYLRQRYVPYNSTSAIWERDLKRDSNNVWTYGTWYRTSLTPAAANKVYHEQKALWSGAMYMQESHTIALSESVSAQANGIVLTFSKYTNGAAQEHNFNHFFVPKIFVTTHGGYGSAFTMTDIAFGKACHKYLYINDTFISGHADNVTTGTGASGIAYANNTYVLRYVYGV